VTLLAPASHAQAAKGMEIAVQEDSVFVAQLPNPKLHEPPRVNGLRLASQLNTTWIRANVTWSYVVGNSAKRRKEPKSIRYNWSGYDALVDDAAAKGIQVQLTLTGPTPAFATGDHKIGPVRPQAGPYRRFARAAAEHFRDRVTRYVLWNEPNYDRWIAPRKSGPRIYRALYASGYAAIKAVDPSAQVLMGETAPWKLKRITAPLQFLRAVTCANSKYRPARRCPTLKTDGYAHHPYDYRHAPTFKFPGADNVTLGTLGRLTSALSKLQRAKLLTTPTGRTPFVYLTEYGYFSSGKYRIPVRRQGTYLVKAFTIAQRNPRVKQLLQYLLVKPPSKYAFFDTSIAGSNGKGTLAFKMLAAWARAAAKSGKVAVARTP
jgi:hypothetical protein